MTKRLLPHPLMQVFFGLLDLLIDGAQKSPFKVYGIFLLGVTLEFEDRLNTSPEVDRNIRILSNVEFI